MTSRRSMQTYGERVSRALQFVPGHVGGRVASAQPIRRRGGTLRTPSVGAAGAVAPPALLGLTYVAPGGTGTTSIAATVTSSHGAGAGDGVIVIACGNGTAVWSPPAGWTTLASGTVTALSYLVAWKQLAGSDDFDFTWTGTGDKLIHVASFDAVGALAAQCTTPTEYTGTSLAFATPGSGWVAPWQSTLVTSDDLTTVAAGLIDVSYWGIASTTLSTFGFRPYDATDTVWGPGPQSGSLVAGASAEWVALALGWA